MSTVVASVAVVCVVALTNSIALVDTAGSAVNLKPIMVPSGSTTARVTTPSAVAHPAAPPAAKTPPATPTTPVAAAPVSPVAPRTRSTPAVIVAAPPPAAHVAPPSAEAAVAESRASGSWGPVREWATKVGLTQDRLDEWMRQLQTEVGGLPSTDERHGWRTSHDSTTSAKADGSTQRSASTDLGWRKRQSRDSPVRRD
ncbi:hypothetical protein [Microbacterium deminutum]|uniref:Secreted protein n=1 Tax=Microbacterium deminutum TaxID=344164 RepID=A0ABN2QUX7_9MICO